MSLSSEPKTLFALNRVQLSIAFACFCGLMLVFMFPPWRQTHDRHPLIYREHLGHHALWSPPAATGEDSWILKVSPSQCDVTINWHVVMAQSAMVAVMGVILCFVFRRIPTRRTLIYTSLLLALCLPVPPADGIRFWFGSSEDYSLHYPIPDILIRSLCFWVPSLRWLSALQRYLRC